jgi:hypothetical protein
MDIRNINEYDAVRLQQEKFRVESELKEMHHKYNKLVDIVSKDVDRKRKNYFDATTRHQSRMKEAIQGYLSYSERYLNSIGLKYSSIHLIPLETEKECDIVIETTEGLNEKNSIPSVQEALFFKDKHNVADETYHAFKSDLNLKLPPLNQIKAERKRLNSLNTVIETGSGVYFDLKSKLTNVLKSIMGTTCRFTPEEKIIIKYSGTTMNIGRNKRVFSVSFTVIIDKNTEKTINGSYVIGLFEIENEDSILNERALIELKNEMKRIKEVLIDNQVYKLEKYFCGDWNFLELCQGVKATDSKKNCLWCNQENQEAHLIEVPQLFSQVSNVLLDLLFDEFQRLTSLNKGILKELVEILSKAYKLPQPKHSENTLNELRNIIESDRYKIFENLDFIKLIPDFHRSNLITKIWKDFNELYKYYKTVQKDTTVSYLKGISMKWFELFLSAYHPNNVTPYIHAFAYHLHDFVSLDENYDFNQQSYKNLNEFISNNYFKSTNRHANYLHQLLNKQNRMEILSCHEKQSDKWTYSEDFDTPEAIAFKSSNSISTTSPQSKQDPKMFSHSIESILSSGEENDFKLSAKKRKTVVDITQVFYQSTNKKTKTP